MKAGLQKISNQLQKYEKAGSKQLINYNCFMAKASTKPVTSTYCTENLAQTDTPNVHLNLFLQVQTDTTLLSLWEKGDARKSNDAW